MADDATIIRQVTAAGTDYYAVLGVSRNASASEIKVAYRKLVLRLHPDKNPSTRAEEAFKKVQKAYETLGDEQKKGVFDRYGAEGVQRQDQGGHPAGGGMYRRRAHPGEFDPFEEVIFQFFGGHPYRRQRQQQQQQQQQQHHQHQQRHHAGHQRRAEPDAFEQNLPFIMLLPLLFFFLVLGGMQTSMFSGDSRGGRAAEPSIFSLTHSQDKGFTIERVTKIPELPQFRVVYYVKPSFAALYGRRQRELRQIEYEVLRSQRNYLERRCYSDMLRRRQQGKNLPPSAICEEYEKYRAVG